MKISTTFFGIIVFGLLIIIVYLYSSATYFEGRARRVNGAMALLAEIHSKHLIECKCKNFDEYLRDLDSFHYPELEFYKTKIMQACAAK